MMKNDKETRMLNVEFKTVDNDEDRMIIEGYAIIFNNAATHYGMTEIIDPKALDSCDMSDVPLKYNHDDSHLLMARTRNGSLQLTVDNVGLKFRADLIDTQSNRDIYKSITAGLLDKCSFAFTTKSDSYDYDTDTRTILEIDKLFDVSVVDVPFYDATSVYARKLDTSEEYFKAKQAEKLAKAKQELLNKLG